MTAAPLAQRILAAVPEALCLQRYTDFYSLFGRFDQLRVPASQIGKLDNLLLSVAPKVLCKP